VTFHSDEAERECQSVGSEEQQLDRADLERPYAHPAPAWLDYHECPGLQVGAKMLNRASEVRADLLRQDAPSASSLSDLTV
jgi:hypothetical protein